MWDYGLGIWGAVKENRIHQRFYYWQVNYV